MTSEYSSAPAAAALSDPHVTEVLRFFGGYAQYPPYDYYLDRGHWVDAACDIVAHSAEPTLAVLDKSHPSYELGAREQTRPLSGKPERWLDYVECYAEWLRANARRNWALLGTQVSVRHETERYVGRLDELRRLADGREAVIDRKTGFLAPMTDLQTALYDLALPPADRFRLRFGLVLSPDARAKLVPFPDRRDRDVALLLVRTFHALRSRRVVSLAPAEAQKEDQSENTVV